mmetsp:Transcript_149796/g.481141  ORF Transcript_149796/g.481141 Transcript_149796/m.481141 type:complete len:246 (-) Transcript_149796:805-1542(-)
MFSNKGCSSCPSSPLAAAPGSSSPNFRSAASRASSASSASSNWTEKGVRSCRSRRSRSARSSCTSPCSASAALDSTAPGELPRPNATDRSLRRSACSSRPTSCTERPEQTSSHGAAPAARPAAAIKPSVRSVPVTAQAAGDTVATNAAALPSIESRSSSVNFEARKRAATEEDAPPSPPSSAEPAPAPPRARRARITRCKAVRPWLTARPPSKSAVPRPQPLSPGRPSARSTSTGARSAAARSTK